MGPARRGLPIRPTEVWLRALYEDAPVAIGFSRDGIMLGANAPYLALFGYRSVEEVVGTSLLDQIAPHARADILVKIRQRARNEAVPGSYQTTGRRTDGSEFPFVIQTTRVLLDDGPLTIAFITDVTEKVRAEATREEALEFNRRLLAASTVGTLAYKAEGQCVLCNEAAASIIGATQEQLLAQNFRQIASWKQSGLLALAEAALADGKVGSGNVHFVTSFGREVWLEAVFTRFEASGAPHLLLLARDTTEQRRAEGALRESEELLRRSQLLEGLGTLAGGIAHDFNNLLAGIMGNTGIVLEDLPPASEDARCLRAVMDSSRQAAELCRQMLTYSGKARLIVEPLSLARVVQGMADILSASVSKKASLNVACATPLHAIAADASQIRQVILNLVVNASEALGDKSGTIDVQVGETQCSQADLDRLLPCDERKPGTFVFLRVRDNGSGMDADTRARLFEPFYTTKFTGRGLGMATVLGIVRGHRGGLSVESQPGQGTTITVFLPASEDAATLDVPQGPAAPALRGHGTVLLVDDDAVVCRAAAAMLERMGFSVLAVTSAQQAIAAFQAHDAEIRLALLDLSMPVMGGEETLAELRRLGLRAPVLFCSGHGEAHLKAKAAQAGVAGYLAKPFDSDQLAQAVRCALEPEAR